MLHLYCMISTDSKDYIGSIGRCMEVTRAFDAGDIEMSPAHAAAKTGLTRATARRILPDKHSVF